MTSACGYESNQEAGSQEAVPELGTVRAVAAAMELSVGSIHKYVESIALKRS